MPNRVPTPEPQPASPTPPSPERTPPPAGFGRAFRLCGRALRLRCPHCGRGKLFDRWVRMRRRCHRCGLILERGEADYFIGAYLVNLIIAELIVVAAMLVVLVATWPAVPWQTMLWAIVFLTIPAVVCTYPFSRSLWLAIDLVFRPPEARDFAPDADVIALHERRHSGPRLPGPDPPRQT